MDKVTEQCPQTTTFYGWAVWELYINNCCFTLFYLVCWYLSVWKTRTEMAVYIVHSTFIFACVARKGLYTARSVSCFPFLCLRLLQVCTSKPRWLHIYIYILPSVDWAGCNLVHRPWQACFRSRAVATNSHHVNMSFRASHSSPLYANRPSKTRTQVGADCVHFRPPVAWICLVLTAFGLVQGGRDKNLFSSVARFKKETHVTRREFVITVVS